jgi:serine/threonine protein kinase
VVALAAWSTSTVRHWLPPPSRLVVSDPTETIACHCGVTQESSRPYDPKRYTSSRLALTPGSRLGVYEVVTPIGEGGMGQVFRARDTKLNRDVALKVLPDSFAGDPDRLARFTREAKTLASLKHPNIARSTRSKKARAPPRS